MPSAGLGPHFTLAIVCAIHVVRPHRERHEDQPEPVAPLLAAQSTATAAT